MKSFILIAVTGGMLINNLPVIRHDKKNDLFLKADLKFREKRCCVNTNIKQEKFKVENAKISKAPLA
jgi:hypothetical protein